ncbi:UmuC domain [Phytophthora cactorum]|nr:UmuC domain [Phytophthora cactorum]
MSDEGSTPRVIIHLDLDCFYAQVEQRRLQIPDGQPVAVQQWGSLLAVNYDARKFGVERGDFIDDAKKKCPQIHLVRVANEPASMTKSRQGFGLIAPHVDTLGENRKPGQLFDRTHQKAILRRYRVASREIFVILGSMVSVIEKASIDEAFMDVTDMAKERLAQTTAFSSDFCQDPANHGTKVFGIERKDDGEVGMDKDDSLQAFPLTDNERLLCIGAEISREIRQAVYSKLGYTCSTGIAGNKLLAKLASPLNKPNGQVVVAPRFVTDLMKSLPMRKIRGLGGKLGKQLESIYASLGPEALGEATEETFKKLSADTFLQRCGLAELTKHVGQETAAYVHRICQGSDDDEPVEEKKVQVKMFSCVKQFDQRSGSALVRVEQLEYGCDERIENKRFPSQLTIQFIRAKPGEKPPMNVMRLHLDSMFPMATLIMNAKNFHDLDSQSVTTISSFFTRNAEQTASADLAAQRMEEEIKQFAAKRDRDRSPTRKSSRQKISAFFGPPSSSCNGDGNNPEATTITPSTFLQLRTRTVASRQLQHAAPKQKLLLPEHADFHFALKLSQTQRSEAMASAAAAKKKKGPLDAFLGR